MRYVIPPTPPARQGPEPATSTAAAVAELAAGRPVVLIGSRFGAPEGHLALAADLATPQAVAFMLREAHGVVCVSLEAERFDALGLRLSTMNPHRLYGASVGVTIEARRGMTNGVGAADRARTIAVAADPATTERDLIRPGHVTPLRAAAGGILARAGRSEAAIELVRRAGRAPAAAVCEVLGDDGEPMGAEGLRAFCAEHGLVSVGISDLVEQRWADAPLAVRQVETALPTLHGAFQAFAYRDGVAGETHLALVRGDVRGAHEVPVHVHVECPSGDVFRSSKCTCAAELGDVLGRLGEADRGIVVYLTRKVGGLNLLESLADAAPDGDLRMGDAPRTPMQGVAAQVLADLGPASVRLLSNDSAAPLRAFAAAGVAVAGVEPVAGAGGPSHQRLWP